MAAFDRTNQKMVGLSGLRKEVGSNIAIVVGTGQAFTVATKIKKVTSGFGMTDTDGIPCVATKGVVSGGQVTFNRLGTIQTSADTITYELHGY